MLQQFRAPDEVAVYYAAAKTLALVSFIYYAVSATTAHRFNRCCACSVRSLPAAGYHVFIWGRAEH